jgi:hypothetical protein
MACNFRILLHKNSESVHLNLAGDFDGSSAHELLNTIKSCSNNVNRVFIHTNGLKEVHPFGEKVFRNHLREVDHSDINLVFTGENGNTLAP